MSDFNDFSDFDDLDDLDDAPPQWVERLGNFDGIDTILILFGFPIAFGIAGLPGLLVAGAVFGVQKVLRQTPLIPAATRTAYAVAKGDTLVIEGIVRAVLPGFTDDENQRPAHPVRPLPASVPQPRRAVIPAPKHPVTNAPAPRVIVHERGQWRKPQYRPQHTTATAAQPQSQNQSAGDDPTDPFGILVATEHWPREAKPQGSLEDYLHEVDSLPVVVSGGTNAGKTSALALLAAHRIKRGEVVMALAFHYDAKKDVWPPNTNVVGAGYRRQQGTLAVQLAMCEFVARYRLAAKNELPKMPFINLVVDEWYSVSQDGNLTDTVLRVMQEGRKAGIFAVITPHTTTVAGMGIEGNGNVREAMGFITMPTTPEPYKHLPRVAGMWVGEPNKPESRKIGDFVVKKPTAAGDLSGDLSFEIPSGCWALATLSDNEIEEVVRDAKLPLPRGTEDEVVENILRWAQGERNRRRTPPVQAGNPVSQSDAPRPSIGTPRVPAYQAGHGASQHWDTPCPAPTSHFEFGSISSGSKLEVGLSKYLLEEGFSVGRVADFLPSKTAPARERVRAIADGVKNQQQKPEPGSSRERTLVLRLRTLRAPLPRIAALLDGNTEENLARISAYKFRGSA